MSLAEGLLLTAVVIPTIMVTFIGLFYLLAKLESKVLEIIKRRKDEK